MCSLQEDAQQRHNLAILLHQSINVFTLSLFQNEVKERRRPSAFKGKRNKGNGM